MKKGFTLVELLATIILLGIIALIAYPMINDQLSLAREKAYTQTVESIEKAARMYGTNNFLGYSTIDQELSLDTLRNAGLLEETDIINPITDTRMTGCVKYNWNETNNMYNYRYDENC